MEQQNDVEAARERESDAADAIAEPPSLSFPEVFRMIQAGEEVPGLQKLDIKPCHDQPTVSQMPRNTTAGISQYVHLCVQQGNFLKNSHPWIGQNSSGSPTSSSGFTKPSC
uniref:Peroxisomal membrane protein PEX14-like KPWE domain-containing protein n=1 Tax=Sinocyclocheilus anshuiensis TaxID=1608454 RepID=A0A671LHS0_9TELE